MNKRITSILLCFVMLFGMLVSAVPAYAAPVNPPMIYIEPDKTEANPGDTITYKFYLQQPDTMTAFAFNIVVPDGLTCIADSGTLGSSASAAWGSTFEWVPDADLQLQWYSSSGDDVTDTSKIELLTIKFTVDDDATIGAEYEVSLKNMQLAAGSTQYYDDISSTVEVSTTKVNVVAKPVAVTGVTIDETLSVKTGESKTPSYTVNPAEATNKAVSFKSDNTAVATVNETTGEVTGVKEGTATITITTADGNFTDTCVVTVACSHANKTPVAEKASDCKNKGWDAYVKCDDCGQLFKADGTTEIAEIPLRELSSEHTGGTATCTAQAVCTVCGNSYGSTLDHSYTAETKKAEALKDAGNCRDKAVYYYSCSACGKVENNDSHTFLGDKVPGTHVGGTTLVNQAEANHKTQTDGYTGDTKCLGCGEIIDYGDPILAGSHTPANVWSHDGDYHWKECTVVGCGIVIDGSKAAHTSTGANVATCKQKAVCDVCGVSYGTVADHDWNTTSWEKDASGHWHKCNTEGCTEKDSYAGHSGGSATCTEKATCSICGQAYGDLASHNYTAEAKKAEALKTAGNCRDYAVYYYSCSACGKVENNDSHTFLGDKVATNHVGGTALVNQDEANHKTQHDGYTGDTKCLGCGEIIDYGETIPAGSHTPASVWSNDEQYHWKECAVVGCGIVIDGSKAAHSSTGANVATCQKKAVCDVCGVSYGTVADHDWNTTTWEKDVTGHWHKCNTAGCTEKKDFAGHTPDHDGGATEEYAIKCSICLFEIEAQLGHTHVFDKQVVDEQYKASGATCLKPATYYKSCACGEKGTETFTSGEKLGHTEGTEWKKDETGHWHICTVAGCGVIIDSSKAAHTPDRDAATETDPIKCSVCGFEIAPALGHTHAHGTDWKSDKDNHWNECACGDKANTAAHKDENTDGKCDVCEYNVGLPTNPDNPQTGDNSMMHLWIILLCISGLSVIATTVLGKKRFVK